MDSVRFRMRPIIAQIAALAVVAVAPVLVASCWLDEADISCCGPVSIPCGVACVTVTNGPWPISMVDIAKPGVPGRTKILESMQQQCTITDKACINGACVTTSTYNMNCIDREVDIRSPKCLGT